MSRFRFSLLQLAGLVALVAACCAALAYASPILAGVVWLLTFILISLAAVAAVLRSQPQRSFWIGFAMLGWLYFLASVGDWISMNMLLQKVARRMPKAMVTIEDPFAGPGGYSDPAGIGGMGGSEGMMPGGEGMMGGAMPAAVGMTQSSYQTVDSEYIAAFARTAQALLTLLLACLGGVAGHWFHARNALPGSKDAREQRAND